VALVIRFYPNELLLTISNIYRLYTLMVSVSDGKVWNTLSRTSFLLSIHRNSTHFTNCFPNSYFTVNPHTSCYRLPLWDSSIYTQFAGMQQYIQNIYRIYVSPKFWNLCCVYHKRSLICHNPCVLHFEDKMVRSISESCVLKSSWLRMMLIVYIHMRLSIYFDSSILSQL